MKPNLVFLFSFTSWLTAGLGWSQNQPPAVILDMRIENRVVYTIDSSDVSKFGTEPRRTAPVPIRTFANFISIADIVSINGQPAKGTWTIRGTQMNMSPTAGPGQAIADVTRNNQVDSVLEILRLDGTPVGTLFALGVSGGTPPPGAPLIANNTNFAIVGGTGAFLGSRGQQSLVELIRTEHQASVTEDPSMRRAISAGSGVRRLVAHVIPMSWPEIVTTAGGPAIVHASDFRLVTAANPARAGETLSLFATGLGPTKPGVDPHAAFPANPPAMVNSQVEVLVNGTPAEVLFAGGSAGATNGYQVNFTLPPNVIPGTATVQLRVAWVTGPGAAMAVQ
jgi:hypothetical protein